MEAVTGWWDDFFWGSLVVVELFIVALFLTILFGLIGAAAKLSGKPIAQNDCQRLYDCLSRNARNSGSFTVLLWFGHHPDGDCASFRSGNKIRGYSAVLGRVIGDRADRRLLRDGNVSRRVPWGRSRASRGRPGPRPLEPANLHVCAHSGDVAPGAAAIRQPHAVPDQGHRAHRHHRSRTRPCLSPSKPSALRASRLPCTLWLARSTSVFQRSSPCRS